MKQQNIAEHIIQMYREENLVCAFDFDLELIGKHVINHLPITNKEKLNQVNHYESLIKKMLNEGLCMPVIQCHL